MRILSGIQPSGTPHLGNYFGMMKPAIELQERGEAYYFIADLHALTTVHNAAALRANVHELALDFLACGLDPARSVFFRQSDVPQVAELAWILSTVTPMGLLERCHSFKDKTARGIAPSHGLFAYPVLMAADILIYDSDIVPVGRDQKQHLEVTRDIAIKMNEIFGSIFKLPEPAIQESTAVVPGLDGAKMSKSYHNTIDLFAPENVLRKKIMGIKTDSTPVEEPKPMEGSVILALHKLVASEADHLAMENDFRVGGAGYGDLKKRLFGAVWEYFAPFRAKRVELEADPGHVEKILADGAEKAAAVADAVMRRVRGVVGIGPGIDNAATRP
jgi:tryptophanyl-tRNA synthetase|uniref:tryptophan--tRNA ligase n=1 Tax=Candidatus Planktophila sp. TaxID=2175601 RepID=UPI004049B3BC